MPNEPGRVEDFRREPSLALTAARVVVEPGASYATKRTVPSALSTPGLPCCAYGVGYAASAEDGRTRAASTTRRRSIGPPFGRRDTIVTPPGALGFHARLPEWTSSGPSSRSIRRAAYAARSSAPAASPC